MHSAINDRGWFMRVAGSSMPVEVVVSGTTASPASPLAPLPRTGDDLLLTAALAVALLLAGTALLLLRRTRRT